MERPVASHFVMHVLMTSLPHLKFATRFHQKIRPQNITFLLRGGTVEPSRVQLEAIGQPSAALLETGLQKGAHLSAKGLPNGPFRVPVGGTLGESLGMFFESYFECILKANMVPKGSQK